MTRRRRQQANTDLNETLSNQDCRQFRETERGLQRACQDTFGALQVDYEGPTRLETPTETSTRRRRLRRWIGAFHRFQTRILLLRGQSADLRLMYIGLDYILAGFDRKMEREGLEASDLRRKLSKYTNDILEARVNNRK